jgi:redox-sensitive bicupin YhaK (pirin superfamily)
MSNLETKPRELTCEEVAAREPGAVQLLAPRDVPLGGPRAMNVRRTLPQKERSLIGGWCFLDHYGPDEVADTGGMTVPPHPHTGLQTVSWLFTGEIEHRDSAGFHAMVRPGELNLMTAGRGISHSEVSTPDTSILHGVQLWVALPSAARFTEPGFEHYAPEPVSEEGFQARVFLGSLLGAASPVLTHSPLVGAEVLLHVGSSLRIAVDPSYEHGVLVDRGAVAVGGTVIGTSQLGYLPPGRDFLELSHGGPDGAPARLLLLGGEPLGESIVMWWNFVGRSHEEIVRFRANWQAQFEPAGPGGDPADDPDQFGTVVGGALSALRAPALPNARLRPRG